MLSKNGEQFTMATQSFLGTGWRFPPSFTQNGAMVELVADHEDIVQSLQILLATSLGERLMQEDFGCDLKYLLFEEINQGLHNRITSMITDAILNFEPRINLEDIDVSQSESENGLLNISILYRVRKTNSRYNFVYPFYINEASIPVVTY